MAAVDTLLPDPVHGKYITVLSIDGGGVKGMIPAIILEYLESLLKEKDKDSHLVDYFDVITGTSTGGLLTAMLTVPNPEDKSRPIFEAKDIKDFYKEHSPKIFPKPMIGALSLAGQLVHPKFDGEYLHSTIRKYLKETRLHETLTNVVIPTYELKRFRPTIFSTYKLKKNLVSDAQLADICIGTSAAPTYLPPHYFQNEVKDTSTGTIHRTEFNLIDGGLAANNPALVAISEMKQKRKENPSLSKANDYAQILLLSLGCGTSKHAETHEAKPEQSWGITKWVVSGALLEIFSDASSEMNDYFLATFFDAAPENYLRIQEYDLPAEVSMDDGSNENLNRLEKIGKALLDKTVKKLNLVTFTPEETNQGTNATALQKLADILFEERQERLLKSAQAMTKRRKTME